VVNLATQPLHKGNLSAGICKSGALYFGSLNLCPVNYLIICQNNQSINESCKKAHFHHGQDGKLPKIVCRAPCSKTTERNKNVIPSLSDTLILRVSIGF